MTDEAWDESSAAYSYESESTLRFDIDDSDVVASVDGPCRQLVTSQIGSMELQDFVVCIPTVAFIVFLLYGSPQAFRKLQVSKSRTMISYYVMNWVLCLVNLARVVVHLIVNQDEPDNSNVVKALWLLLRFSIVFVEVSVVVFFWQGFLTLRRRVLFTNTLAAILALVITTAQAYLLFGYGIDIIIETGSSVWFYTISGTIWSFLYLFILNLKCTRWHAKAPGPGLFKRYLLFMLSTSFFSALGCLLIVNSVDAGVCISGISWFGYYGLFAPVLYVCFLKDFLARERELPSTYYSELIRGNDSDDDYEVVIHPTSPLRWQPSHFDAKGEGVSRVDIGESYFKPLTPISASRQGQT